MYVDACITYRVAKEASWAVPPAVRTRVLPKRRDGRYKKDVEEHHSEATQAAVLQLDNGNAV